jgi:hypothetical protein
LYWNTHLDVVVPDLIEFLENGNALSQDGRGFIFFRSGGDQSLTRDTLKKDGKLSDKEINYEKGFSPA